MPVWGDCTQPRAGWRGREVFALRGATGGRLARGQCDSSQGTGLPLHPCSKEGVRWVFPRRLGAQGWDVGPWAAPSPTRWGWSSTRKAEQSQQKACEGQRPSKNTRGGPCLCPDTAPSPMQAAGGARPRRHGAGSSPTRPAGATQVPAAPGPSWVASAPAALEGRTRPIPGSCERCLCRPSRPIPLPGPPGERRTQDAPGVKERGRRGACQVPSHSSGPLGEPEGNSPLQGSEAGSEIYFCLCE